MKDIAYSNIKRGSILNSILTKAVFSTRSSCWLWWSTNKTRPAMENKPSSAQIQCENFLRTGRRYSAARRRIFRRFLPQFTTKSRIPHQHRHPYRKFNQKKTPPPKIKFWNWPTSQIQSVTPNKTRPMPVSLTLSKLFNFWVTPKYTYNQGLERVKNTRKTMCVCLRNGWWKWIEQGLTVNL